MVIISDSDSDFVEYNKRAYAMSNGKVLKVSIHTKSFKSVSNLTTDYSRF